MAGGREALGRPLVAGLFAASVLLSLVSFYTTQQGMALYLSPWFAIVASLGVQSALVLVAWLFGIGEGRRAPLVAVYAVTATVSIAFSYVSLHGWFAERERPAEIQRRLYDELQRAGGRAQAQLTAAVAEAESHALALEEMTAAEKAHGFVSRAEDADPWLARVREAVAREAASYDGAYPEGQGPGLRYTAFDRHARLARQALERLRQAAARLAATRAELRPLDASEAQLAAFRRAWDAIPWDEVREVRHAQHLEPDDVSGLPAYSDFVDRAASGQEALLLAFVELVSAPKGRHLLALALAAFIDLIVFLLAYASGPFFLGSPEVRWIGAAAALDARDPPLFLSGLLRKTAAGPQGLPRLEQASLSAGERQLLLVLAARGLAAASDEADGRRGYLLDASFHRLMVESLAEHRLPLRAAALDDGRITRVSTEAAGTVSG